VIVVGPDETETLPLSDVGAGCSDKRTARGLVSMCRPWAAGDFGRTLAGSSCQPMGVGGMGVSVVWPGLRVGGAEGRVGTRLDVGSVPGPILCDLELPGGGPGGGGGNGTLRPQLPDGTIGDSSMGVRVS